MVDEQGLLEWLQMRRMRSAMTCTPVAVRDCVDWRSSSDALVHRTGGYFSIVAARVECQATVGDWKARIRTFEQPFINQPEVGLLGFILRHYEGGIDVLVQAKSEPGNVGMVQLSPTVQATVSNYTRCHGGEPTPYLDLFFNNDQVARVSDSVQSEQGTRFLNKFNRNAVVRFDGPGPDAVSDVWRWSSLQSLLNCLPQDHQVNTDARSVLTCCPWNELCVTRMPFSQWHGQGGFGEELAQSYGAGSEAEGLQLVSRCRDWQSAWRGRIERISFEALRHWRLTEDGLLSNDDGPAEVRTYSVTATDREVRAWSQPLVAPKRKEQVVLLCQRRSGALRFLLRASVEPGFLDVVQMGPTMQTLDGVVPNDELSHIAANEPGLHSIVAQQSDEGGRFFQSLAEYRVVQLPDSQPIPDCSDMCWSTLRGLELLAGKSGALTNEARSVISLLLSYV